MKLKNVLHKAAAGVLVFAMVLSSGQIVEAAPTSFPAAFTRSGSTYLVNGNFDGTDNFVTSGNAKGLWYLSTGTSGEVTKDSTQTHSGAASVKITGSGNAVDQQVELKPDTEYELSVWVYAEGSEGARVRAFLNGGANQSDKKLVDTDANCQGQWYQYTNTFTTNADTTYANVGVVRANNTHSTSGTVYVDDFEIREVNAPVSVNRTDAETIQVEYPATRNTAPSDSDVSLSYSINGAPSETLDVSVAWDSGQHTATLTHDNVSKNSETTVDFELQVSGEIFTQTVTLPANPNYVGAEIAGVSELKNGSAILTLKQAPTRDLTAGEIGISYTDYEGQPATLSVANVQKRSNMEYFVEFGSIAPRETDKTYTLTFEIGGASVNENLTVATTAGKTFYLDATNGNDNNDGTSSATAWQSLDKVNNTEFMAGSSLLLK